MVFIIAESVGSMVAPSRPASIASGLEVSMDKRTSLSTKLHEQRTSSLSYKHPINQELANDNRRKYFLFSVA